MADRTHKKFVEMVALETYLSFAQVQKVRKVLTQPRGSSLPWGPVWFKDLAARAKVRPAVASCVVEWFMQNPQQQGRIDDSWLADIKQDLRMALWDVLSRSPLSLPDLNVYSKVTATYVFWSGGASFQDVHTYLATSSVQLVGMHDVASKVHEDIGDFFAVGGQRVTLRRVLSPEHHLRQANHGGYEPPHIWDASASPFGDGYLISPVS